MFLANIVFCALLINSGAFVRSWIRFFLRWIRFGSALKSTLSDRQNQTNNKLCVDG